MRRGRGCLKQTLSSLYTSTAQPRRGFGMRINRDSSRHKVEDDGRYPAMKILSSKAEISTEWFQEYMAADGNNLSAGSDIIQAVVSDDLDIKFVEQQIQESGPRAPIVNGFCDRCQNLFDHWPTIGGSSTREHDSMPNSDRGDEHTVARPCSTFELEASTRSGCRFCTFLLQSLKDSDFLDTLRKIEARLYCLDEKALSSLSIQNWGTNPTQLLWLNLPGKICTNSNSGIARGIAFESRFLPASADCFDDPPDVFDIARNWLFSCTESHGLCKSNGDGILPTRLISICSESLRLVNTSGWLNRPRYATLSHCWGSGDTIKLTSRDLDTYMEGLPVERFPKTFKDAIKISKKLGLKYLWIDSLCIIQDSVDNWQKESALMGSVFGGSTITIAASSARDGSQGCFMKPTYFSGGLRARITDGGLRRVQEFSGRGAYERSTIETHLGTRAWALQEKMLSPRTIHFGDRGAFWECRRTIASEYLPHGFPHAFAKTIVKQKKKFHKLWPQLVQLYSAANLTFGKDKLPALSGVARFEYNETGDQYLAGLWRDNLVDQLCWFRRVAPYRVMQPRPPWRAPTWSWASIDNAVTSTARYDGIAETMCVQVLDASTTKCAYDPFGQVTSGLVRLACSTMAVGYLVCPSESNSSEHKEDDIIVSFAGSRELRVPIVLDCQDDSNRTAGKLFYLLPLRSGNAGYITQGIWTFLIQGIVLQSTGVAKGELSRIGSFTIKSDKSDGSTYKADEDKTYERFLSVLKEHGAATAEEACTEVIDNPKDLDNRYVITLI